MAQRTDDIRHDIRETRAAMTGKLAILEERVLETVTGTQVSAEKIMEKVEGIMEEVRGTVEEVRGTVEHVRGTVAEVGGIVKDVKATVDTTIATVETTLEAARQGVTDTQASVQEIVEHMKGAIETAVASVQRTFDLPAQAEQHPWLMVGGALVAGYVLGRLGGDRPSVTASPTDIPGVGSSGPGRSPMSPTRSARPQEQPGIVREMLEQLQDEMQDEIASLKNVAVKVVMNTLRTMFQQAIPALTPHFEQAHTKRGGPGHSPAPQPVPRAKPERNGVPS